MNVAARVREEKEQHPERFCNVRVCLWRVRHLDGRETPCPKHAALAKEVGEVGAPLPPAASAEPLDTLTAEQVCAKMYPATWSGYRENEKEQPLANAQRHLDAIRTLCSPATRSGR